MVDVTTDRPAEGPAQSKQDRPEIAQQIEDALRQGSKQIQFDSIEKRFRGKRVWVLDRDKMQTGVMRVVDQAILKSLHEAEGGLKTRQRVATAIAGLFSNKRNLTSPVDADQVRARPKPSTAGDTPPAAGVTVDHQIAKLTSLIGQAERVLALASSASRAGSATGRVRPLGPRRRQPHQDKVLIQIFEDNLELIRGMNRRSPNP